MTPRPPARTLLLPIFFALASLLGCSAESDGADGALHGSATEDVTGVPSEDPPTRETVAGDSPSAWNLLQPGFERRDWRPDRPGAGPLVAYRLDPARVRFEVGYRPENPPTLAQWQTDSGADLVVNGGYFDDRYRATALVVSEGERHGRSYLGFGGMFSVGPGGPEVRWLRDRPFALDEAITAAVQSFPVLIAPDGDVVWSEDSPLRARRTVVAQDRSGHILFIIAPDESYTLKELALTLAESDLDLRAALNLDGGGSTAAALRDPPEVIPAFSPLPLVILVHMDAVVTDA